MTKIFFNLQKDKRIKYKKTINTVFYFNINSHTDSVLLIKNNVFLTQKHAFSIAKDNLPGCKR